MKKNRFRFIHVLWHDDLKFNPHILKMIQEDIHFNVSDHLFITPHERVYDRLKEYSNIELVNKHLRLNSLLKKCDILILHSIPYNFKSRCKVLMISDKKCKRIVLRTWGHDLRDFEYSNHNIIKNFLKKAVFKAYLRKISELRMIGVANDVDVDSITSIMHKTPPTRIMSYSYDPNRYQELLRIKECSNNKPKEIFRIIVGHAALKSNNHVDVLNKISKYSREKIVVSIPLSYPEGNEEYKREVKKCANKLFAGKVEFIEHFMNFSEYSEYIDSSDIMILDGKTSYALGNISIALFFNKKLYLNREGVIAKSMSKKGIKVNYTDQIENECFESFLNNEYDEKYNSYVLEKTIDEICNQWSSVFSELYP